MTKDEWESMTGSAGWPKFRQYLRDFRESLKEGLAEGKFSGEKFPEAVFRCQILRDLSELQLIDVQKFYGTDQPPPPEMKL